ncbi:MAG: hypothetical protein IKZ39_02545, partial [Lachnospiraceae bacterium]|nr:hypothetical protein [Lachnospiraceae bacterium]
MKLIKRLKKLNIGNKGVTFVELICAIGILSLVGTAVVGLVLVASRSYQRSVLEIEVQQEAQFAANLIGDLLKDAEEVDYSGNPIVITKANGGSTDVYRIYHQADNTLRLSLNGGTYQLMAENVTSMPSVVPTYTGSSTYTVNMGVQRTEAARQVEVTNSNNARNEKPEGITEVGEITANILAPGEMILEPNQSKGIPFAVTGVSNTTVYWSLSGNTDASTRMDGNTIIVGPNETAPSFYINGVTAAKKKDG